MNKKVVFLPYDMDTALGINNEGDMSFGYGLEDTDTIGGANVFNGQNSVLWRNMKAAFGDEIQSMYRTLRASGQFSYEAIEQQFEDHQSKWPEAIFNEDSKYKYIDPLVEDGNATYLYMLLGSKEEQRKWWLYNRFRYMDSKYNAGDSLSDAITIRGYAKDDITVTPYADIYPSVKYGSYLVQTRGQRNTQYTLECPLDTLNDTEIYIYSASQLKDIGDVSGLMPGFCDFASATRLQNLKIGSNTSGYSNANLVELNVGNLPLLKTIDVRNCPSLTQTVNLSGCNALETAYFSGTAITGVELANGGAVQTLVLPNTITNLTLRNLTKLSSLTVAGYSNVSTLWLEGNHSSVNSLTIFNAVATGARVRILGIQWSISNWSTFFTRLKSMRGLDENGNNMTDAQISGSIYTSTISSADLAYMHEHYPNVTMTYTTLQNTVYYYNEDGTTLYQTKAVNTGGTAPSYTPSKTQTAQYTYSFAGWALSAGGEVDSNALKNVTGDRNVYAVFNATVRTYTVTFYNESTLLQTVNNVPYGGSATYTNSTPTKEGYDFTGWSPEPTNIQGDTSCYAQFVYTPIEVEEITDDWATIISYAEAGTAAEHYSLGNYKPLIIGSETINYQIIGIEKDTLADNSGKAALTFMPMNVVGAAKNWNPSLVTNYSYAPGPSFGRYTTTTSSTDYNRWDARNVGTANNVAKITFTATAVTDGTLEIQYYYTPGLGNLTKLYVDGEDVTPTSGATQIASHEITLVNGTTYTIVYETTRLDATNTASVYVKLCNTSGSGKKSIVDALASYTTSIDDCAIRSVGSYDNGTGTIGGWGSSLIRTYLNGEFFENLVPSAVGSHIKQVSKTQRAYNTGGTRFSQVTNDKIWLLSSHEVGFGDTTEEGSSVMKYSASVFPDGASRVRAKVGESATTWWLRSSRSVSEPNAVATGGTNTNGAANLNYGLVPCFCI